MSAIRYIARGGCVISLTVLLAGCIVGPPDHGYYGRPPPEGYYDRAHDRYYHDHAWHRCRDRDDEHCRR